MHNLDAQFIISNSTVAGCPPPTLPEYAFIGRSNVGKSSLINMMVGNKKLAKTSGTPGKTQLINHFIIEQQWYLVDLPGYGFAKVSKTQRASWTKMIKDYLEQRQNLLCLFVLLDVRLEPQKIDLEFMQWIGKNGLPFAMVFTKSDKLSGSKVDQHVAAYKRSMLKDWAELPPYFVTSSETGKGREELVDFIRQLNRDFKN
ncbi:ribosome biogenesis GTP-binding protein YihA/YsxC [Cesiribacter sp. SM1]|uniref:ribosome biogenesis GTP-binding protein YihA/YsxC n=1 Tax=Cesiribacter sp. SM1 TaxID=2861196 RepID=UPI001CD1F922|nr:ribosome biogenesis GTP-binding protein YihA/YsxC [Cesiribacter sp. SM1]